MSWTVRFSSTAEKRFRKLDRDFQKRIAKEIVILSGLDDPIRHPQVKPLTGDLKKFCRLRVGDYRIIFSILKEKKLIAVVNLVPRGDAY